ncbi:helix-turn-helix domain-containing protein [Dyadobacter sp. CY261]|uniref:helix-turn-helix domain-containing protein n=1 Tax=Dyadobacter sp. CY261 TaxID=2907203 RepID=UPI001F3195BD|nr:helix-turn-helix transcriptional regulator [Dyadobacter sp. CY261]MCF0075407.1 helix-turn-helix domain-containing protein [Dyadobacter sp. CY261]
MLLSPIEKYIVEKVREKRKSLGLSQMALSQKMEMTDTFVSHVEAPSRRAKYNINHLNALAKALDCSPKDFLPEYPL